MRNFGLIIFIAAFSFSAAVDFPCVFTVTGNDYECRLYSITYLQEPNVRFTGTHASQKTDADVSKVFIYSSNTISVIPQIFTQFPNIQELGIYYSNLMDFKLSEAVQLSVVVLQGNNVTVIGHDSLKNQIKLTDLRIYDNYYELLIHNEAFRDLKNLKTLQLERCKMREIRSQSLTLPNVEIVLLQNNEIVYIPDEFVKGMPKVSNLILSNNHISQVHPYAFDSFKQSPWGMVHYIDMKSNWCVSSSFPLINYDQLPDYWTNMNNLLPMFPLLK